MLTTAEELWISRPAPPPHARLRLFCFPYAGGTAADFRAWPSRLPTGVDVVAIQLPGRANRVREPRFMSLTPLVEVLQEVLRPHLRPPFAFFGHSMGALIAYALARRLHAADGSRPVRLYVSGHRAPHLPSRDPPVHSLPDREFLDELRQLNGTPEEILRDAELRELMLPLLRADFAIAETYVHVPGEPLDCPVLALGGRDDPLVSEPEVRAWRETTTGPFRHRMIPGDHFFPQQARGLVLAALADDLQSALGVAEVPLR